LILFVDKEKGERALTNGLREREEGTFFRIIIFLNGKVRRLPLIPSRRKNHWTATPIPLERERSGPDRSALAIKLRKGKPAAILLAQGEVATSLHQAWGGKKGGLNMEGFILPKGWDVCRFGGGVGPE